jgi:mannose-1-phosphate guanylyltransferase
LKTRRTRAAPSRARRTRYPEMQIKQAFVLAAGLGTRLRPLTEDLPKPLIPIFQKPLITFALDHLIALGVEKLIVNTHHLAQRFEESFPNSRYGDRLIRFVHEPVLLETGGGIKNIEHDLGADPFITYSGDILTDINLQRLVDEHFARGNQVTLALRRTGFGSSIRFQDGRVISIGKTRGAEGNYDFANVAVWGPAIFNRIPPGRKIAFIPIVSDWLATGGKVGGVVLDDGVWFNIGSRSEYFAVHRRIAFERWSPHYIEGEAWRRPVAENATVDATAHLRGCFVVSQNCTVEAGALLEDTIVWPGAQIASRSRLSDCIVRTHRRVEGEHVHVDL